MTRHVKHAALRKPSLKRGAILGDAATNIPRHCSQTNKHRMHISFTLGMPLRGILLSFTTVSTSRALYTTATWTPYSFLYCYRCTTCEYFNLLRMRKDTLSTWLFGSSVSQVSIVCCKSCLAVWGFQIRYLFWPRQLTHYTESTTKVSTITATLCGTVIFFKSYFLTTIA